MSEDIRSKALELASELLEPAVDALLGDGVLKELPILGVAVKLAAAGRSISDRIFLAKIQRFVDALDDSAAEGAKRFASELEAGDVDAKRTAAVLLLSLEQLNDLEKAPITASIFSAYLRGEMTKADFRRIMAAVNAAVTDDLLALVALKHQLEPERSVEENAATLNSLQHTGLTQSPTQVTVAPGTFDLIASVTDLGEQFARALAPKR